MQYTFKPFYWQMSEDDSLVRTAQVLYSENLDLTSNTKFVTLSPKPKQLLVTSDKVQAIYFLERGIDKPLFGDDSKKIYLDNQLKYTASLDVRMFWSNSKYLYWLDYGEDIYRILLTDVSGSWTWKVTKTEDALENDSGKWFVVEQEWVAFIWYGTKLYEISNDTWQLVNQYDFLFEKIVWMIDARDVIEIIQKDWKVQSWDRVSDTANSYDLWIRVAIVVQSANERFLIWEWSVYIVSGAEKNKVAWQYNSDVLEMNKFKFRELENSNVWFLKDVVYLGTDSINTIAPADNFVQFGHSSVLMLGNKKSGLPVGMSKYINTSSDGSKYTEIYGMTTKSTAYSGYNDTLYITYKNANWVYWVDYVDLDEQNFTTSQEWILILPEFDGGNDDIEKRMTKLSVRADWGNDAGKFYLYKVEKGVLVPFNWTRDLSFVKHTDWVRKKELTVKENFHNITLAIVFKQDADTPKNDALKLYSLTIDYEPVGR